MRCEECGGGDMQRLQVAHEMGTQDVTLSGPQAGVVALGGDVGVEAGMQSLSGTSQTAFAAKAAPPRPQSSTGGVVAIVIGVALFLTGLLTWSLMSLILVPIGLVVGGLGGLVVAAETLSNRTEYPALLKQWQESWVCLKCGHICRPALTTPSPQPSSSSSSSPSPPPPPPESIPKGGGS